MKQETDINAILTILTFLMTVLFCASSSTNNTEVNQYHSENEVQEKVINFDLISEQD